MLVYKGGGQETKKRLFRVSTRGGGKRERRLKVDSRGEKEELH